MRDYRDEDGILRCGNCNMKAHDEPDCDKVVHQYFKNNMRRIVVKDGSERSEPPKSTGRI